MKVSDKKTKFECRLIAHGTDKANARAISDLDIPDPEFVIGEQIIKKALEEDEEDDGQSEDY